MKQLLFVSGDRRLSDLVAKKSRFKSGKSEISQFSDGEIYVRLKESVKGRHAVAFGASYPPADNLMELLILINTIKINGAKKITVVMPYFAYAKADHPLPAGISMTAKLLADAMKLAGANKTVSVNVHSEKAAKFFGSTLIHLDAIPLLAQRFKKLKVADLAVVSPDMGGQDRAKEFARHLKIKNIAYVKKFHPKLDQVAHRGLVGDVRGRNVVIVDDMVQSGRTILQAIKVLKQAGAKEIYLAVTHIVNTGPGVRALARENNLKKILFTNTIPHKKLPAKFEAVDVSGLIADSLASRKPRH